MNTCNGYNYSTTCVCYTVLSHAYNYPGGKVREISREAHRRRGITRYLAQLRDNALFRACSRVAAKQRVYRRNFAVYRAMSINTFHEGN